MPSNLPKARGRVFLVNIGVNRTTAAECDLQYAVSDATELNMALIQHFKAEGYTVDSHLLTATDVPREHARVTDPTKEGLRLTLVEIGRRATPDDIFILSYSGHGYTDATDRFYLFPADIKGNCRHLNDRLLESAISTDELAGWIRPIDAGEMTMIIDACYSAASIEGAGFRPGPMGSLGLGQLAYDKRIRVLAASQAAQPAGEAATLKMGYLSYALVKNGLEKNQADWQPHDGSIFLQEWLAYGAYQTPKLYEAIKEGRDPAASTRGFGMQRSLAASQLQTPALFDFRNEQDQGPILKRQNH